MNGKYKPTWMALLLGKLISLWLSWNGRREKRDEQEIFSELSMLCISPGYIHAIAHLAFRDNMIAYKEEMTAKDMRHLFSMERLVRTEISTLIGLMIKEDIDYTIPKWWILTWYIKKTDALLEEIHHALSGIMFSSITPEKLSEEEFDPFSKGDVLREVIFYGGESAYAFQYRDFAPKKYASDDAWLELNKGFSIQSARDIVFTITEIQNEKMIQSFYGECSVLMAHAFAVNEIVERSAHNRGEVEQVLSAFVLPIDEKNENFCALHDFNATNATPLIPIDNDKFILFQQYSLVEALYESPFFWMHDDKKYLPDAMQHRGKFTEEFSMERLEAVFGKDHVYANVDVLMSKGKKAGEIDVLVVFGGRAIILQAKSKRLTIESRKGNDNQIQDDFKKAIQDSYNQGYECARLLGVAKLVDDAGKEIIIKQEFKEIYIFCVVSDHYPALSFQARQFLRYKVSQTIFPPFILDVFTLDVMAEMLTSPLLFLSYVNRRVVYSDKLMVSHELTILSHHIKNNLWFDDDVDRIYLHDDITADLDVAMVVRRDGVPGKRSPEGLLTLHQGTPFGRLIEEIEARPDDGTIDLGFFLLTLNGKTIDTINSGIETILIRAQQDRKSHDITIMVGNAGAGLTIHCNDAPIAIAGPKLQAHCEYRKRKQEASVWFGICIEPRDASLRFGLNLNNKHKPTASPGSIKRDKNKVGRNDPCPCGSGLKYKKCCLSL